MLLCSQVGIAEQFIILLIIIIIIIIIIQSQTESNLRVPHYSTAALVPALDLILILISIGHLASNRYPHHRCNQCSESITFGTDPHTLALNLWIRIFSSVSSR
jgi:hypothetical protein